MSKSPPKIGQALLRFTEALLAYTQATHNLRTAAQRTNQYAQAALKHSERIVAYTPPLLTEKS